MKIRIVKFHMPGDDIAFKDTVLLDLDKLKIALGEKRLRDLETFILEEVNKK